jgi:hypothetical protein
MTRLQAKLRKSSDERSKVMLEACIRLLTSFGARDRAQAEAPGNDVTGLAKNVQTVATTAEDVHLRSDAALSKIKGLIEQCLEVDPEQDEDDDGEAAIVLVNVQAGLEEAKEILDQLSKSGIELVNLLTMVFDGLHGHQYNVHFTNGSQADTSATGQEQAIPVDSAVPSIAEPETHQDEEVSHTDGPS